MSLTARELIIGYRGEPLVSAIDLQLGDGEVLALLGPNGCGKSTLFRTLMGLLPAVSGDVLLHGESVSRLSRTRLARVIGYVPQHAAGYFPFTVLETVLMGRTAHLGLFSAPGAADRRIAIDCLARLGIADLAERPFTRISGGQRQLTLIARALAQDARILILDEPTASLDFGNELRVLDWIGQLADEGRSIVLSTHNPDHADRYADRVAVLHQGRLRALGEPNTVLSDSLLSTVYDFPLMRRPVASPRDTGGEQRRVTLPRG